MSCLMRDDSHVRLPVMIFVLFLGSFQMSITYIPITSAIKTPPLGCFHSTTSHRTASVFVLLHAYTNEEDSSYSFPWIKKSLSGCGPLSSGHRSFPPPLTRPR